MSTPTRSSATLLQLDASADLEGSRTRAITSAFADAWVKASADRTILRRDLHVDALPHLPHVAVHGVPGARDESLVPTEVGLLQAQLLDELLGADVVVVGAPMYNYSVPSTLKAWIDYIHLPGVTAGDTRPLAGRPVVIVTASGLAYDEGSATDGWDFATPYLRHLFGTILGMDVHVIASRFTAAESVPAFAEHAGRARTEFAAAIDDARSLAATLR